MQQAFKEFRTMSARQITRSALCHSASPPRDSKGKRRPPRRLSLEALENRIVLTGSWTNLAASGSGPPDGGAAMMLLSDGSILIQDGFNKANVPPSANVFKLLPQANTGSYVNGAWTGAASMNESRLFFTTVMLPN